MNDKSRWRGQESISAIIASVERGVGNSHVSTIHANHNKNKQKGLQLDVDRTRTLAHSPDSRQPASSDVIGAAAMQIAAQVDSNYGIVDRMPQQSSGYPQPQLYDQHFINKFSYPKGFKAVRRDRSLDKDRRLPKQSLYDYEVAADRRGVSGWKLTVGKRNSQIAAVAQELSAARSVLNHSNFHRRHKSFVGHTHGSINTIETHESEPGPFKVSNIVEGMFAQPSNVAYSGDVNPSGLGMSNQDMYELHSKNTQDRMND
jgi:hypothetical protein